jgi:hypothetical protein
MKAFVLILLTLFLCFLLYLKFEMAETQKASTHAVKNFFTQEYIITDIEDNGYYGKDQTGKSIFFKKEHLPAGTILEIEDAVVIYFEKGERIDGIVKVEKKDE